MGGFPNRFISTPYYDEKGTLKGIYCYPENEKLKYELNIAHVDLKLELHPNPIIQIDVPVLDDKALSAIVDVLEEFHLRGNQHHRAERAQIISGLQGLVIDTSSMQLKKEKCNEILNGFFKAFFKLVDVDKTSVEELRDALTEFGYFLSENIQKSEVHKLSLYAHLVQREDAPSLSPLSGNLSPKVL
ncbi:hypothetical protein [Legionella waltersii]|uniref:Uncharacterized protein n=1 Tax=Legionella waltersii TaxID=66969 RepID=A0A0W1A716_9GAMM|nr:hypothetical protein [Legionella waltersii]KTD77157.1 hypothetical protein Lwal_1934 [Legionella waltersii]SNV11418.1 Uncharacterised protein [Legionella waltersii]